MGELIEQYKNHTAAGKTKTEFEHKHIITMPPVTEHMQPRVLATAPMKVQYSAPETARQYGLDEARITAEMVFQDAIGLFAAIDLVLHQSPSIWLTECRFLDEKLAKLGMQKVSEDQADPATFKLGSQLFHELAEQDFCLRGAYHGKPYEIRIAGEHSMGAVPLRLDRNKDAHELYYADSYTLRSLTIAKPEEVMEHVAKLEQALEQWEQEVKKKYILTHGTIGELE